MKSKIGASTGVFYPHIGIKDSLKMLKEMGVTYVEIGQDYADYKTDIWQYLTADDFSRFEHISIHSPANIRYKDSAEIEIIFKKITHLQTICDLKHVVIHPDVVDDFSIFNNVPFQIAFENMDWLKPGYQSAVEFEKIFNLLPTAKLVLDVNHIWTNDKSMKLVDDFYKMYADRVAEFHVSGFSDLKIHDGLWLNNQFEIVNAIKINSVPLIIESQLDGIDSLKKEINYIEQNLIR